MFIECRTHCSFPIYPRPFTLFPYFLIPLFPYTPIPFFYAGMLATTGKFATLAPHTLTTSLMTRAQLFDNIKKKSSYLCVGLDTDLSRIPKHLLTNDDPVFEFNKQIIDATHEYAVAYKPNIAFYEALGPAGWVSLQRTLDYIPSDIFTIADAKRGDIGNTSALYAKAFFEKMDFDSITVAPYMGEDSVKPFLHQDKWVFFLRILLIPEAAIFNCWSPL